MAIDIVNPEGAVNTVQVNPFPEEEQTDAEDEYVDDETDVVNTENAVQVNPPEEKQTGTEVRNEYRV